MSKLVMVRTTNNLHIMGRKGFFKNLFKSKALILDEPYFIDFVWGSDHRIERVYMNTMKLLYAKNYCALNTRHILFQVKPDDELIGIYNSMSETVKKSKSTEELL